jgi:hypothetical protein
MAAINYNKYKTGWENKQKEVLIAYAGTFLNKWAQILTVASLFNG